MKGVSTLEEMRRISVLKGMVRRLYGLTVSAQTFARETRPPLEYLELPRASNRKSSSMPFRSASWMLRATLEAKAALLSADLTRDSAVSPETREPPTLANTCRSEFLLRSSLATFLTSVKGCNNYIKLSVIQNCYLRGYIVGLCHRVVRYVVTSYQITCFITLKNNT